jgi:hypothetical protein
LDTRRLVGFPLALECLLQATQRPSVTRAFHEVSAEYPFSLRGAAGVEQQTSQNMARRYRPQVMLLVLERVLGSYRLLERGHGTVYLPACGQQLAREDPAGHRDPMTSLRRAPHH